MDLDQEEEKDDHCSDNDIKMMYILNQRKSEVVHSLVTSLTRKNKDLEQCLNANLILADLTDNEVSYPFVGDTSVLGVLIDAAIDNQNQFSHYATNIVVNIIKEYPEHEKLLG